MSNPLRRIKLTVSYDGTAYSGWQAQKDADTIAGRLNDALSDLLQKPVEVIGASRTDAGVHALGNVCAFDTDSFIPADRFAYALNARLPQDIVVQKSCEVRGDFHPRHSLSKKTYEYRILHTKMPQPNQRRDSYFYPYPLDVGRMKEAASYLVGRHDFKSFSSVHAQSQTSVRILYACSVSEEGDFILIRVTGSGFLYNMVRIIAGTLIEVGAGKRPPKDMMRLLCAADRTQAGPTAPAAGLLLLGIEYEEDFEIPEQTPKNHDSE